MTGSRTCAVTGARITTNTAAYIAGIGNVTHTGYLLAAAEEDHTEPPEQFGADMTDDDIIKAQQGDRDALAHILKRYEGMVVNVAQRLWRENARMTEIDDLIQEGMIAFMEAIRRYQIGGTATLGSYARKLIRYRVIAVLTEEDPVIRQPRNQRFYYQRAVRELHAAGEPVTVAALMDMTGMKESTIKCLMTTSQPIRSLDAQSFDEDDDATLGDNVSEAARDETWGFRQTVVSRPTEDAAIAAIEQEELCEQVEATLDALPAQEAQIVRHFYGLGDFAAKTYAQIGAMLNLQHNQVYRALVRARDALRAALHAAAGQPPPRPAPTYRGVERQSTQKWAARIRSDGERISLGTFDTPEAAAQAYNRAARKYHGARARLNQLPGAVSF